MISFLHGILAEKHPTRVELDVGGVGYEVFIPLSSYDKLPRAGYSCHLRICEQIREDAHVLFGFVSEAEHEMFKMLVSASGVGPKLALSALSGLSVRDLKQAIAEGDVRRLSSISGIGKKVAERISVELRDKVGRSEALEALAGPVQAGPDDIKLRDAAMALIALGYKQNAARKMVEDAMRGRDIAGAGVEEIIKLALT